MGIAKETKFIYKNSDMATHNLPIEKWLIHCFWRFEANFAIDSEALRIAQLGIINRFSTMN